MQHLGHTRSAVRLDHILQTPDTFVRAPLPGMKKATAIVHVGRVNGASFTQYTAEFEAGGALDFSPHQRFLYVLEGQIQAGDDRLEPGGFAYLPRKSAVRITAPGAARAAVIERHYESLPDQEPPSAFTGRASDVPSAPLLGDEALQVQSLVPADTAFDFAVNVMTFLPGASLPMVEIHVMEHGLLMLEGGGIYRLGDSWYPVAAGDFIWMAQFCPQWFGALGKTPAKYLIYKDWNR
jgi:(S)-ureidoglycine aminohydrolase